MILPRKRVNVYTLDFFRLPEGILNLHCNRKYLAKLLSSPMVPLGQNRHPSLASLCRSHPATSHHYTFIISTTTHALALVTNREATQSFQPWAPKAVHAAKFRSSSQLVLVIRRSVDLRCPTFSAFNTYNPPFRTTRGRKLRLLSKPYSTSTITGLDSDQENNDPIAHQPTKRKGFLRGGTRSG